jgi:hypothetical protein
VIERVYTAVFDFQGALASIRVAYVDFGRPRCAIVKDEEGRPWIELDVMATSEQDATVRALEQVNHAFLTEWE